MKKNKLVVLTVALASVIGFKSVNVNAATTYAETLPETVTRRAISEEYKFLESGINLTEGKTNNVIEFLSDDNQYLLYCSDRNNINTTEKVTLTKGQKLNHKIAYVLAYGEYKVTGITNDAGVTSSTETPEPALPDGKANEMANIWITQLALWNLQGTISKGDLNNNSLSLSLQNKTAFSLLENGNNISALTLWKEVEDLVSDADKANNPEEATLAITGNTNWTTSDNILKTDLLTMNTGNDLVNVFNYSVSLENAPEGTKIYKEDGTDITNNLNNIDGNTKIYVVVDRSKIDSKKEYVFKLNTNAVAVYDAAYQYVDKTNQCNNATTTCQPSVLVGPEVKEMSNSVELKITPDTASSISNTIYYIGFIILLSGIGIIYANIRPRKQESE